MKRGCATVEMFRQNETVHEGNKDMHSLAVKRYSERHPKNVFEKGEVPSALD